MDHDDFVDCYWIQISDDGHKAGKDAQPEGDNRNQCYYCNLVCRNANALRRHCRQAHGKDRCHVCSLCNKAFKRATHLKVGTHQTLMSNSFEVAAYLNMNSALNMGKSATDEWNSLGLMKTINQLSHHKSNF